MEEHYPQSCPFCKIALAYPPEASTPIPQDPDADRVSPQCFLLLSTPFVLAFLDIMPISQGHILLIPRHHAEKLSNVQPGALRPRSKSLWRHSFPLEGATSAQALGFWLPILSRAVSRALDFEDWNIVQNNGIRAAQVVGHVHFHLIPRYPDDRKASKGTGKVDVGQLRSWKMFGKGQREDLDEEEAEEVSSKVRAFLRQEVDSLTRPTAKVKL